MQHTTHSRSTTGGLFPAGPLSRRAALRLAAGGVLAGALASRGLRPAGAQSQPGKEQQPGMAQPGAPGGPPGALSEEAREKLVQFVQPEKTLGYLPGMDEGWLAALFGLELAAYRALKERFDARARAAAEELLADPAFAERVDRLPFQRGDAIVGIGESVTADRQGWLEILRHLLALRRPQDELRVVNQGIEGTTTTQALGRLAPILTQRPAWLVSALGAADAVRYGRGASKTAVSLAETARNLAEMRRLAAAQGDPRWVWITPPTVNEEAAAAYPPFRFAQLTLRNEDLLAVGDLLRGRPRPAVDASPVLPGDPVVDIQAVFGAPAPAELVLSDGIHPALAGQQAIARALVERLTA